MQTKDKKTQTPFGAGNSHPDVEVPHTEGDGGIGAGGAAGGGEAGSEAYLRRADDSWT